MRLLAIDTTGPACCVALRVPGQADLVCSESMARGQAERLAPMVQEMLTEAGLEPGELDRIGVTTGPGSFAGTRVGVAFARGLALATGADCVGVSNLAWWVCDADLRPGTPALAVHDAKRGEVVRQFFDGTRAPQTAITQPVEEVRKFHESLSTGGSAMAPVLVGTGAHLLDGGPERPLPGLRSLLDLAGGAAPPFESPRPFYARPPDAKLPGGKTAQ